MELTAEELKNFELRYNKGEFPHQRFGQAFCNLYNITFPELFYEENYKTAKFTIWLNYMKSDGNYDD